MKIRVNGKAMELQVEISIHMLLAKESLTNTKVAVEINGDIVPAEQFQSRVIKENDEIEILHFMGGGRGI